MFICSNLDAIYHRDINYSNCNLGHTINIMKIIKLTRNKQENNSVNVAKFINFEKTSISTVKQLYRRKVIFYFSFTISNFSTSG